MPDYRDYSYEKVYYEVTEKDIDEYIDIILYNYSEIIPYTDKKIAEKGDAITVNIKVFYNDTLIEEVDNYSILLGSNNFNSNVESQLIGCKKNNSYRFKTNGFDKWSYIEDQIDLEIDVISIGDYVEYELTDEFVQTKLGYKDVNSYCKDVRSIIETENREREYIQECYSIIDQVVNLSEFYIDEEQIAEYALGIIEQYQQVYEMNSDSVDISPVGEVYVSDELFKTCYDEALLETKRFLVIGALAKELGIMLSLDTINEYCENKDIDFDASSASEQNSIKYEIVKEKVFEIIHDY